MDIGGELRRARNARKLSVNDIADDTKISQSILRAIERNAFHDVPGGLFTRGYLKAYALKVGLDPEPIVAAYRAEFDPPAPAAVANTRTAEPVNADAPWTIEESEASSRHSEILQFSVILIVALVYLGSLRHAKPANELEAAALAPPPAVAATVAETPVAAASADGPANARPVGTSGSVDTVKPAFSIEIHPSGACWVDVTADGTHSIARMMNAGDRESIAVRDDLALRVGDPAAFAFTIDGAAGRSLGSEGHAVTVRVTRANYRTLLAAPATP